MATYSSFRPQTQNLVISGDTTLGDASGDTLTFNASTASIPNNLNIDSGTLFIDASTDRVGIGTSSPATKLDLSANNSIALRLTSTDTGATANDVLGVVEFYGSDASSAGAGVKSSIKATVQGTGGAASDLRFYTSPGSTNNEERMIIDLSGNVGIGTSSPAIRLSGTVLSINDAETSSFELANAGSSAGELFANVNGTTLSDYRSLSLMFRTNNTERMRIDSSGNISYGDPDQAVPVISAGTDTAIKHIDYVRDTNFRVMRIYVDFTNTSGSSKTPTITFSRNTNSAIMFFNVLMSGEYPSNNLFAHYYAQFTTVGSTGGTLNSYNDQILNSGYAAGTWTNPGGTGDVVWKTATAVAANTGNITAICEVAVYLTTVAEINFSLT